MEQSLHDITISNISFRYREEDPWVLKDLSLTIRTSEWVAIVGHNGSGKSTLAKMMNGLLLPETGTVHVGELQTQSYEQIPAIRKQIGMVFQNPDNQIVAPTVQDDIAFALENSGVEVNEMKSRVQKYIEKVGLSGLEDAEPHKLSGGQKQRVAIAGAVALQPRFLILDEATSMLDPEGKTDLLKLVKQLKEKEDVTVVSITHDLDETLFADRIVVMNQGEVMAEGDPAEIYAHKDVIEKAGLDQPFIMALKEELQKHGVDLPEPNRILTKKALVDALCTLKR